MCDFNPQWALLVDWSAVPAYEALTRSIALLRGDQRGLNLPVAYLNFRVYALSQFQGGQEGEAERQFYERMEGEAVGIADVIAALSTRYSVGGRFRPPKRRSWPFAAMPNRGSGSASHTRERWSWAAVAESQLSATALLLCGVSVVALQGCAVLGHRPACLPSPLCAAFCPAATTEGRHAPEGAGAAR